MLNPIAKGIWTEFDLHLFHQGKHYQLYKKFGSRPWTASDGKSGWFFSVWAPLAREISVIGDWNGWESGKSRLEPLGDTGIWVGFFTDASEGNAYKYRILSYDGTHSADKADPYALQSQLPPSNASLLVKPHDMGLEDSEIQLRSQLHAPIAPLSIYEMHLGSWKRYPINQAPKANSRWLHDPISTHSGSFHGSDLTTDKRPLTYLELAEELPNYLSEMGFTHVEFLPITEYPLEDSWGYQVTGYFAPTSRYGTPEDFRMLVKALHKKGIGVILDWVPSHFPTDEHGLGYFGGYHLYEHEDPRLGFHPDWKTFLFNYGKPEVQSFLISSALFWLNEMGVDGIRVDAVASMLYLDYSRKSGEWIPNQHGGRENLDAIHFLKELNSACYQHSPHILMIAEESTSWPLVSHPVFEGGLGFGMKWDMGWMHDTLEYFETDPLFRKGVHNNLTFRQSYAFSEKYILSLSHDEVVHGKGSLLRKMPGNREEKFANLRLLYSLMYATPGKKLLMMGSEFGSWNEWYAKTELDWSILAPNPSNPDKDWESSLHRGIQSLVKDLNHLYKSIPDLFEKDLHGDGLEWMDCTDEAQSIISFVRHGYKKEGKLFFVFHFTPVWRENYRIGVPHGGVWKEIFNSDLKSYGGSIDSLQTLHTEEYNLHNQRQTLSVDLKGFVARVFQWQNPY